MTGMKAHFHAELSGESFSSAFRKSIWVVTHFQLGLAEFTTPLLVHSHRGAPKSLVWIECIAYYFFGSACMPISCKMGVPPKKLHPKWPKKRIPPRQTVDKCTSRMPPNFAIFNMVPPIQTNVGVISQQFLWPLGHPRLTTNLILDLIRIPFLEISWNSQEIQHKNPFETHGISEFHELKCSIVQFEIPLAGINFWNKHAVS